MTDLFHDPQRPPARPLPIDIGFESGWMTVAPHGEIDLDSVLQLQRVVESQHEGRMMIDLRGVSFMDSTGLSVIASAARRYDRDRLRIICDSDHLLDLFRITRMDTVLDLRDSANAFS